MRTQGSAADNDPLAAIPGACTPDQDELTEPSGRHLFVLLDFFNRCNLRCSMCYLTRTATSPVSMIGREHFARIAAALFPVSHQVSLSCAYEPFMFPDIFDYMATAQSYQIPVLGLSTNAALLNREKAGRLVAMRFPLLNISVDAATPATYESIRVGANFADLLANLSTLAAVKREARSALPRLQFSFVLMEKNLDEALAFVRLMLEFKPYRFAFMHQDWAMPPAERRAAITDALRLLLAECVARQVLFEEVPAMCIPIPEMLAAYGVDPAAVPLTPTRCRDPWHFMRITPEGDVFRCVNTSRPAGNILRTDIREIWNGEHYTQLREKLSGDAPPAHCRACGLFRFGNVRIRRRRDLMDRLICETWSAREKPD